MVRNYIYKLANDSTELNLPGLGGWAGHLADACDARGMIDVDQLRNPAARRRTSSRVGHLRRRSMWLYIM